MLAGQTGSVLTGSNSCKICHKKSFQALPRYKHAQERAKLRLHHNLYVGYTGGDPGGGGQVGGRPDNVDSCIE